LAALALTSMLGGDIDVAAQALCRFVGLPHRLQRVGAHRSVEFVDDSKGTNVGATVAALKSMRRPVVLIAGGLGKGADFAPIAAAASDRLVGAVLIGEAAADLERVLAPVCRVTRAASMSEAVAAAFGQARPGDTVLLSPACASQDMFRDYRERGEAFRRAFRELER
jgi:UDP-N-acetylmuramoylalanine--D-glutamate ligase